MVSSGGGGIDGGGGERVSTSYSLFASREARFSSASLVPTSALEYVDAAVIPNNKRIFWTVKMLQAQLLLIEY